MSERLDRAGSLAYVRDRVGDDREPFRLTDHEITAAVLRRDDNLDLAAADLRDLLESRTGADFGAAWARKTAQLRERGLGRIAFGDWFETNAQFGDVVTPAGELEPAGPPDLILVSVLRVNSALTSLDAVRRYFRSEDFLNEPRTDHIAKLPPTPSYERFTDAARRLLAVAVTYEFDDVKVVDDDGNDLGLSSVRRVFPAPDFAQFRRLSFTRDGRDFKIYPCIQDGSRGVDHGVYFGGDLRFAPDDDDGGS